MYTTCLCNNTMFCKHFRQFSVCLFILSIVSIIDGEISHGEQLFGLDRPYRLSEYNKFGDVSLFRVVIPPRCFMAKWELVVLKSKESCPETYVTVAIQPQSLPIPNPYNTTFPLHTNTQSRQSLHLLNITSGIPFLAQITNPTPGDWYAAAFLPKSGDGKIEQKGLGGTSCYYFWRMAVFYWQREDIEILSSQATTVVRLSSPINKTTAMTYRFFVPALTKSVNFTYQNCQFRRSSANKAKADDSSCPVEFRIKPNSLPSPTLTPPVACASDDSCLVQIAEPFLNTWYYVRLDTLPVIGNLTVEVDLGVEVQSCDEHDKSQYNKEPGHLEFSPNTNLSLMDIDKLPEDDPTIAPFIFPQTTEVPIPAPNNHSSDLNPTFIGLNWCPRVIPLSTAQLTNPNPFKTFIHSILSSSNELRRTDVPPDRPVVLSFELDRLRDPGGNLVFNGWVAIKTESGMLADDKSIFITLCLRRGAIPPLNGTKISCDPDGYSITFNNDTGASVFPWIIPFPAPGVWYLSMESSCESSAGQMYPCNGTAYVNMDISLYACIDGCGDYGDCRSAITKGVVYYYCDCKRGYRGWACTDDSEAWSQGYFLSRVLLLTLSNILFIFPCILALKRHHFVPAISYFATLIFSSFYHCCDSGSLCIMSYDTLQFCDFFSSFMSMFLTLITMARLPVKLTQSLEILGVFGLVVGTSYDRFSLWAVAVPVGVGISTLLLSWSRRWYKRRQCYPTTKGRWLLFILPGTAVVIIGLCIFAFLETSDNYQYVHSAWHVAMAIGVLFLLPPRERKNKQHYNHMSELVDINALNSELVMNDEPLY